MTTLEQKAIAAVGCKRDSPKCLNCADYDCKKAIRGFIAGYTEALRWRDVNMELPEYGQVVLCKYDNPDPDEIDYFAAQYVDDMFYTSDNEILCEKEEPTHWRPIETI